MYVAYFGLTAILAVTLILFIGRNRCCKCCHFFIVLVCGLL